MLSQKETDCIRACHECAIACLQCAAACVKENDPKPMAACITADMACADFCQLAAAAIARGDTHANDVCALCAKICQTCATECGKHDMEHCKACTVACKRCADACTTMAVK